MDWQRRLAAIPDPADGAGGDVFPGGLTTPSSTGWLPQPPGQGSRLVTEVATAHHYLTRLERSADRPQAALGHLVQAARILQGGQAGPGSGPLRVLNKLLFAELYACTGDKAKAAKLLKNAIQEGQMPGGQPEATAALVQHILQPTRATAAELDRYLEKVRHHEAAVYVDLALTLARHGTADAALAAHVERAKAQKRRWARP